MVGWGETQTQHEGAVVWEDEPVCGATTETHQMTTRSYVSTSLSGGLLSLGIGGGALALVGGGGWVGVVLAANNSTKLSGTSPTLSPSFT